MTTSTIVPIIVAVTLLAQASSTIRVDTFDQKGKRTGYLVIDPRSGRIDQFDSRSRRTGYGYTQPSSPGYGRGSELLDRNGNSITVPRSQR